MSRVVIVEYSYDCGVESSWNSGVDLSRVVMVEYSCVGRVEVN